MVLNFYYHHGSIPCAIARMTAKAINVDMHLVPVDLTAAENYTPHFIKINPQSSVPVLIDDGLVLNETRAIMIYLIEKYAPNDPLYPDDPRIRAAINQRLFFDAKTLFQRFYDYCMPAMMESTPPRPENRKSLLEAVGYLEGFFDNDRNTMAVGNSFTLADISLLGSVAGLEAIGFNFEKYPNTMAWFIRAKSAARDRGALILDAHIEKFKKLFPGGRYEQEKKL